MLATSESEGVTMIFGKTYEEKHAQKQAWLRARKKETDWFAWFPVKVYDGRWVWLQTIKVNWCISEYTDGELKRASQGPLYYTPED